MAEGEREVLSIVPALAALGDAAAREAFDSGKPFVIAIDDVPIRVAYTSGTTPTVWLSTPYAPRASARDVADYRHVEARRVMAARPLGITLAKESEDERQAKAKGVTREVQTGDADFDREVYIDTRTHDTAVLALLAPQVRGGVRELFARGFAKLEIDNDAGEIATSRGMSSGAGDDDGAAVARAFAAIAAGVPQIDVSGRWVTRRWAWAVFFCMMFAVPAACITALVVGPTGRVLLGELAGCVLGAGVGMLLARTQHGHSNSHWRVRGFIVTAIGGFALVGAAVALALSYDTGAMVWFIGIPLVIALSLLYALRSDQT